MGQAKLLKSKKAILGLFLFIAVFWTLLRLVNLGADMPTNVTSSATLYGDEGEYARNALRYVSTGNWYVPGDFNHPINYPVYFVLQVIVFKLFGGNFETVRALSAVSSVVTIFTIWLIIRQRISNFAATITAFLISSNYFFFAFSRYGQADMPMLLFVVLSLASLLLGKTTPGKGRTILSAFLLIGAILIKTTAIFAIPVLLLLIWQQQRTVKDRVINLAVFLGIIGLSFAIYRAFIVEPYLLDYQRVAAPIKYRLYSTPDKILFSFWQQFKFSSYKISRLLYASALICGLFLLFFWKAVQDRILVLTSLLWLVSVSFLLSFSSYQPSRYFSHLLVPLGILIGIGIDHLIRVTRVNQMRVIGYLMLGIVLFASFQGMVKITQYLSSPQYSMYQMADDIHRQIEAEGISSPLLLGAMSGNVTLANGIPSIGAMFGYSLESDASLLLNYHHPTHYIELGSVSTNAKLSLDKSWLSVRID